MSHKNRSQIYIQEKKFLVTLVNCLGVPNNMISGALGLHSKHKISKQYVLVLKCMSFFKIVLHKRFTGGNFLIHVKMVTNP